MNMFNILLKAETAEPGFPWVLLLGMFIIMYFFMIRPQQKRQKEAKKSSEMQLAKGDKVVTIGGVHGKILSISDLTVVLEVESGKIRVSKSALSPSGSPELKTKNK